MEEVARAAGLSVSYYRALERGTVLTPSAQVLDRVSDALGLDPAAREYARHFGEFTPVGSETAVVNGSGLTEIDEFFADWSHLPAEIHTRNFDIVRTNKLMDEMTSGKGVAGQNLVELFFCRPELRDAPDWRDMANSVVAALRFYGDPLNPRLRGIVGRLLVTDPLFRKLWASSTAASLESGTSWQTVDTSVLVNLNFRTIEVPGGYFMYVMSAAPDTAASAVLDSLAERAAA